MSKQESGTPVKIGPDAWVGVGAIVRPGAKISHKAIIGAGSVIATGNPYRVAREFTE